MKVAFYGSERENRPEAQDLAWPALAELLTVFRVCGASCPGKACSGKSGKAWSPVDIEGPRNNANVRAVTVAVFDLDHLEPSQVGALDALEARGLSFVAHSTHSHTPADVCLRLALPLSRPVLPAEWQAFWSRAVHHLGIPADNAAKDVARLFFLPTRRPDVAPFVRRHEGRALDVDALLSQKPAPDTSFNVAEFEREEQGVRPASVEANRIASALVKRCRQGDDMLPIVVSALRGEGIPTGQQDTTVHRLMSLTAAVIPHHVPEASILEVFRPCFRATEWGEGLAHLEQEALKKLRRARERSAQKGESPRPLEDTREPAALRTWADLYGPDQLLADFDRPLVSLASLPSWPGGPATGHGIGEALDRALGGGIRPGYGLGFSAGAAKSGKTMFLHQIADGLALRTAKLVSPGGGDAPLTPVVWLSEMPTSALTWRSLARWTGEGQHVFRAGRQPMVPKGMHTQGQRKGEAALRDGLFAYSRRFVAQVQPRHSGAAMIHEVAELVSAWRESLAGVANGREVWPVVVFDPIQRWLDHSKTETEGGNELVETLGEVADRDEWVFMVTSDTIKPTPKGDGKEQKPRERGALAFRGTYKLQHLLHAGVYLEALGDQDNEGGQEMGAYLVFNRWGGQPESPFRFAFDFPRARFEPLPDLRPAAPPPAAEPPKKRTTDTRNHYAPRLEHDDP